MDRLMSYPWPGNVRELENVVERELILCKGGPLNFQILEGTEGGECWPFPASPPGETRKLDEINAQHIRRVLQMTRGIIHGPRGAAAMLDINPSTLRSRMKKLGIAYGKKNKERLSG